jgi:hypothetical protein
MEVRTRGEEKHRGERKAQRTAPRVCCTPGMRAPNARTTSHAAIMTIKGAIGYYLLIRASRHDLNDLVREVSDNTIYPSAVSLPKCDCCSPLE